MKLTQDVLFSVFYFNSVETCRNSAGLHRIRTLSRIAYSCSAYDSKIFVPFCEIKRKIKSFTETNHEKRKCNTSGN